MPNRKMVTAKEVSDNTESFDLPDSVKEALEEEVEVEEIKPEETLIGEEEEQFVEALYVGRRRKTVNVFGHTFKLHTLTVDEELQLVQLTKPWSNAEGFPRAFRTAVVAASVDEIDGEPVYVPLSPIEAKVDVLIEKKWDKLREFYPILIDSVYAEFLKLEEEMKKVVDRLPKSSS